MAPFVVLVDPGRVRSACRSPCWNGARRAALSGHLRDGAPALSAETMFNVVLASPPCLSAPGTSDKPEVQPFLHRYYRDPEQPAAVSIPYNAMQVRAAMCMSGDDRGPPPHDQSLSARGPGAYLSEKGSVAV